MKIAVASGKGGTGKTTVATNLAHVAALRGRAVAYVDCDVEAPNGHLFLHPELTDRRTVHRMIVRVDAGLCSACGRCEEVCAFSAIVRLGKKVVTYPQLCQGCGACTMFCAKHAIIEEPMPIGIIESGMAGDMRFAHGLLAIGEPKGTGLIREVKEAFADVSLDLTIVDAPPGAACPVVEAMRGADLALLVAEPTPFGFHDFKLVLEAVRGMHIRPAVVINRADMGGEPLADFCRDRGIPILAEIPEDRALAQHYARGRLASTVMPNYLSIFEGILDQLVPLTEPVKEVAL